MSNTVAGSCQRNNCTGMHCEKRRANPWRETPQFNRHASQRYFPRRQLPEVDCRHDKIGRVNTYTDVMLLTSRDAGAYLPHHFASLISNRSKEKHKENAVDNSIAWCNPYHKELKQV